MLDSIALILETTSQCSRTLKLKVENRVMDQEQTTKASETSLKVQ